MSDENPITLDGIRNLCHGVWWTNFFKVATITALMGSLVFYGYSSDQNRMEDKLDLLIEVVQEDVDEIKIDLALEKKIREEHDLEIRNIIATLQK